MKIVVVVKSKKNKANNDIGHQKKLKRENFQTKLSQLYSVFFRKVFFSFFRKLASIVFTILTGKLPGKKKKLNQTDFWKLSQNKKKFTWLDENRKKLFFHTKSFKVNLLAWIFFLPVEMMIRLPEKLKNQKIFFSNFQFKHNLIWLDSGQYSIIIIIIVIKFYTKNRENKLVSLLLLSVSVSSYFSWIEIGFFLLFLRLEILRFFQNSIHTMDSCCYYFYCCCCCSDHQLSMSSVNCCCCCPQK